VLRANLRPHTDRDLEYKGHKTPGESDRRYRSRGANDCDRGSLGRLVHCQMWCDFIDLRLLRFFRSLLLFCNSEAATPAPTAAAAAAAPRLRDRDLVGDELKLLVVLRFVASKDETAGGGAGAGTTSRVLLL